MNIYVTYGAIMFIFVLFLENIEVISKDVAFGLYLISLGLQICGI